MLASICVNTVVAVARTLTERMLREELLLKGRAATVVLIDNIVSLCSDDDMTNAGHS
jgi:hypothetical protein